MKLQNEIQLNVEFSDRWGLPKNDINNSEIDNTADKVNQCITKIMIKNNVDKYYYKIEK